MLNQIFLAATFAVTFLSSVLTTWKLPYFNEGKDKSGKNGVLIKNLMSIFSLLVFLVSVIVIGKSTTIYAALYVVLSFVSGLWSGSFFCKKVLNRKYKDEVKDEAKTEVKDEVAAAVVLQKDEEKSMESEVAFSPLSGEHPWSRSEL